MSVSLLDSHRPQNSQTGSRHKRPRVVFLGKGAFRYEQEILEKKFELWSSEFDAEVAGVGRLRDKTVGGVRVICFPELRPPALSGLLFYSVAPMIALIRALRGDRAAIVCQSPLEGFATVALTRALRKKARPVVVVELHGDWRSATNLYGHRARRGLSSVVAGLGRWTLRRADLVRAVSEELEKMARSAGFEGEVLRFPTYSDYDVFTAEPPAVFPASPQVAFIGSFEASKGVDVLVEAWPAVAAAIPEARLLLVGDGRMRAGLENRVSERGIRGVSFLGRRPPAYVGEVIDTSSLVVLPSRTEGLPRVISEAFSRGRAVVASRIGGIPELVEDDRTGLLVPPGDAEALADALIRALRDPEALENMGREARRQNLSWNPMERYRDGMRLLSTRLRGSVPEAISGEEV